MREFYDILLSMNEGKNDGTIAKIAKIGSYRFYFIKNIFYCFSFHPALNDIEKKWFDYFLQLHTHLFVDIIVEIVYL